MKTIQKLEITTTSAVLKSWKKFSHKNKIFQFSAPMWPAIYSNLELKIIQRCGIQTRTVIFFQFGD